MMVVLPQRPPELHDDDNEYQPPPKVLVDETKHAIKDWVQGAAGVTSDRAPPAAESAAADHSPRRDERAHPQRRSNNNTTSTSSVKDNATKRRSKGDVASTYQHDTSSSMDDDAIMLGETRTRQGEDDVPFTAVDRRGDSSIQTPHSSCDAPTQSSNDTADNSGKSDHGNGHHNDGVEHTHEKADDDTNNFKLATTLSTNFSQYLMDVIELESQREKPCILEWAQGGEAFYIRDKIQFERIVLPKHFGKENDNYKCKFMSFVRKLYRWGFRQGEKTSSDSMIFSNPNFIRGNKHRCLLMRSKVNRKPQQSSLNQAVVPPPSRRVGAAAGAVVDHGVLLIPAAAADPRFHLARTATNHNNTLQDHHGFSLNAALGHQEQQYAYANLMARQEGIVLVASSTGGCRLPAFSPDADLLTLMYPPTIGTSPSSTHRAIPTSHHTSTTISSSPHRRYLPARTSASFTAPTMSVLFEPRHQHHHNLETTTTLSQQQSVAGGINVGSTKRIDSLPANATTTMSPFNLSLPPGWPPPADAAALGYQSGVHLENNTTVAGTRPSTMTNTVGDSVNVVAPTTVILASQIMINNPGMEPWRALELAKRMCGVVPESDTAFGIGSSLP